MKSTSKKEVAKIEGMFQGSPSPPQSCNIMVNMMFDDKTKSWHNFFGWEKYFTGMPQFGGGGVPYPKNGPVHSLYCHTAHNGAKSHLLFEQENELYEVNGSIKTCVEVQGNRKPPAPSDYVTSYEPFGNYVVIANGNNAIIKYRGGKRLMPVGWSEAPGPPSTRNPASDPSNRGGGYFLFGSEDYIKRNNAGLPVKVESQNWPGVGFVTKDHLNEYFYKVTFINENGSESPISQASDKVQWTTTEFAVSGVNTTSRTGVILTGIATGPEGTVARKIYRTKNNALQFFFCMEIYDNLTEDCVDFLEDDQLGSTAPNPSDSIVMPSQSPRFAASFQNCLFIDGGKKLPSRVFYSNPLQLDSFGATSYFDLGNREGGDVTALFPYYNNLFVFRERAIDVIIGSPGSFSITPFVAGVGCKSHSSIAAVPGVGVVFLAEDGIYAIQGNFAGYELKIVKLSTPLDLLAETLSRGGLKRAVGIYWPQAKEYHCYIADYGNNKNSIGMVLHGNGGWSVRSGWPIACATIDYDGNFIFGHDLGNASDYNLYPVNTKVGNGLNVISGKRVAGYVVGQPVVEKEIIPAPPLQSWFRSRWEDFGYGAIKKQIKYVYLYAYTTGQQTINLGYFRDGDWHVEKTTQTQTQTATMSRPDHVDQPNYSLLAAGAATVPVNAIWDTSLWQDQFLTEIRVAIPLYMCSSFAIEVKTDVKFEFIGYSVEYNATPAQTIRGKGT